MVDEHPKWQAHLSEGYDDAMSAVGAEVVARLHADRDFRLATLRDPRRLHADIFREFAPSTHPEYAGTYRGTPLTPLEHRAVGAALLLVPDATFNFEAPEGLPAKVDRFLSDFTDQLGLARSKTPRIQLLCLAELFCNWGRLHPFLDGNGHIQRILFAAAAIEMGIPLSTRFAVHPRTYDELLAFPLEMFTRSNGASRYRDMVAEYVSTWLSGPFDAPGSGIAES